MTRCAHQYVVTGQIVTCRKCPLSVEVLFPDELSAEAQAERTRKRGKPEVKPAAPNQKARIA